jgi:hypothetical protein
MRNMGFWSTKINTFVKQVFDRLVRYDSLSILTFVATPVGVLVFRIADLSGDQKYEEIFLFAFRRVSRQHRKRFETYVHHESCF